VNPALVYLVVRSAVNGAREKVRRLRNPRYLLPALVGAAYFAFLFGCFGRPGGERPLGENRDFLATIEGWATLGILASVLAVWFLGGKGPGLAFTEAEIAVLFTAPLRRRELVHFKILQVQTGFLILSAIGAVLAGRSRGPEASLCVLVGVWLAFNALFLHQVAANFTLHSLVRHGVAGFRRHLPVLLVVATAVTVVVVTAPPLPHVGLRDPREVYFQWFAGLFESGPGAWVLAPFRALPRLPLSPDLPTFLERLGPVALGTLLLYYWVLQADVAFEEAAAAQAVEITRAIEQARRGRITTRGADGKPPRCAPWVLRPRGRIEGAFLWKGVTAAQRNISPVVVGMLVLGFLALGLLELARPDSGGPEGRPPLGAVFLVSLAGLGALYPPRSLGSGLREDLEMVALLKTLPVRGPRLVRAELLSAAVPVAAVQAVMILVAWAFLGLAEIPLGRFDVACGVLAVLAVLPCVTLLSAGLDAAGAVLLPAWLPPGSPSAAGGIEGTGRGILTLLGKTIGLGLGLTVPGALGAGVALLGVPFVGGAALVPAALLAGAALLAETWLLAEWLGARYDALDPADEGLA